MGRGQIVVFLPLLLFPDSKVYGTNMGPTWVLLAPDGPHVGPINLVSRTASAVYPDSNVAWPKAVPTSHGHANLHCRLEIMNLSASVWIINELTNSFTEDLSISYFVRVPSHESLGVVFHRPLCLFKRLYHANTKEIMKTRYITGILRWISCGFAA